MRIRRLPEDRSATARRGTRRYRCAAAGCAWRCLLQRGQPPARGWRRPALAQALVAAGPAAWRPVRKALVGLVTIGAVGLPLVALLLTGLGVAAGLPSATGTAPGVSHFGAPLPARHDLALPVGDVSGPPADGPALALREGCAWGRPGSHPYRGTTAQALQAARLPPEVVRQIVALQQAGQKSGRLEIRRGAIREVGGARAFDAESFAMTFGHTLCLNSRVNFAPGHVEPADLYEVRDDQGRRHAVMVPDVCGNVSVLAAQGGLGPVAGLSRALARRSLSLAAMAEALARADSPSADAQPGDAPSASGLPREAVAGAAGGTSPGRVAGGAPAWGDETAVAGAAPSAAGAERPGVRAQGAGASGAEEVGGSGTVGSSTGVPGWNGSMVTGPDPDPAVSAPVSPGPVLSTLGALSGRLVPRGPAVAGLAGLAEELAKRSKQLAVLTSGPGDRGAAPTGTGSAASEVPEPGTLACVLAALALMAGVMRRRR